ncbi:hypothetical protein [Halorussus halophilus]|uniref:hypothetical protein n=1 Tax=Halorussus halophilus TaxID=2650975 RepID=UPI001787BB22|nr:hypothetical protein [Halorussus halophilus]
MLDNLQAVCDGSNCERTLREADCQLVMVTAGGERRAYECACGAVTVTVAR